MEPAETAPRTAPAPSGPVVVAGAAHWDVIARSPLPLPPGADLPGASRLAPGGVAARLALGLAAQGLAPVLLSAVGRDGPGRLLRRHLARAGVDIAHLGAVRLAGGAAAPTGAYVAIEGPGGLHAAVADCAALEAAGEALLAPLSGGGLRAAALVLDGNLPEAALRAVPEAMRPVWLVGASPAKAARLRPHLARLRLALALNRAEAEALAGRQLADAATAARALLALGAARAVITDGPRPCADAGPGWLVEVTPAPARAGPQGALRVTGAGDAFAAAHIAATLAGAAPDAALSRALASAARHIAPAEPGERP